MSETCDNPPPRKEQHTQKKNNDNINYFSKHYQPACDNGAQLQKRPRLNHNIVNKDSNKKKADSNYPPPYKQRNSFDGGPPRPLYNPLQHERQPYVPGGSEMFYQNGRLPTGMYVTNRNSSSDDPRSEERSNDSKTKDDTIGPTTSKTALIPKSHFLLKSMTPKSKNHVAVPFLQCNATEKASTKEPSTSKKTATKDTPSAETSTSAKEVTEKANDEGPSLEEIEREFQTFPTIKRETGADNDDSDAQPPSIECEAAVQQSPSTNFNHSNDFSADTLAFNYQFSSAHNELHFPDPSNDKNALIAELNNSIANLRSKKASLMQHSKDLTSQLHRVLTEVEVLDIQIEQILYKAAALRN